MLVIRDVPMDFGMFSLSSLSEVVLLIRVISPLTIPFFVVDVRVRLRLRVKG